MNTKITGKNIEVTDAMKDYIEKRVERLEKFEGKNTDINVVCSVEKDDQIVEIQINHNGEFMRVEERNEDLYASVDLAIDRAERQLRKEKEKRIEKNQDGSLKDKIIGLFNREEKEFTNEVTQTITYDIKPKSVEDAKLELSSTENTFLVFVNQEDGKVNVIYKRNNGSFGMVVPE